MTGQDSTEEALTTPAPALRAAFELARPDDVPTGDTRAQAQVHVMPVDPRTLYCFWNLEPSLMIDLIAEAGDRMASLCQLTLVVQSNEKSSEWHAPVAARSLYVRAVAVCQPHLVDVFLTFPSGERRFLAASNVAPPPPERPSIRPASRAVRVASGPRGTQLTELPGRSARASENARVQSALPSSWAMGGAELAHVGASDQLGGASDRYRR